MRAPRLGAAQKRRKETRSVKLGGYLGSAGWAVLARMENLKSFDEFLERRFPESRRKAYTYEHLPPIEPLIRQLVIASLAGTNVEEATGLGAKSFAAARP